MKKPNLDSHFFLRGSICNSAKSALNNETGHFIFSRPVVLFHRDLSKNCKNFCKAPTSDPNFSSIHFVSTIRLKLRNRTNAFYLFGKNQFWRLFPVRKNVFWTKLEASEPVDGSVKQNAAIFSPDAQSLRYRSFWSSVPRIRIAFDKVCFYRS